MKIKQVYLLLSANVWAFKDEGTGELKEGVSLQYYPNDTLSPQSADTLKGLKICNGKIPFENKGQVQKVPAWYEFEMTLKADKYGKPTFDVANIKMVKEVV